MFDLDHELYVIFNSLQSVSFIELLVIAFKLFWNLCVYTLIFVFPLCILFLMCYFLQK
jgi:hypothetical protein